MEERQEWERETGGLGGTRPHEEQSFVEGGLKITSSFVKQNEKSRRDGVSKHCSEHKLIIAHTGRKKKHHFLNEWRFPSEGALHAVFSMFTPRLSLKQNVVLAPNTTAVNGVLWVVTNNECKSHWTIHTAAGFDQNLWQQRLDCPGWLEYGVADEFLWHLKRRSIMLWNIKRLHVFLQQQVGFKRLNANNPSSFSTEKLHVVNKWRLTKMFGDV